MRQYILILVIIIPQVGNAQVKFNRYFETKSMRFDFLFGGNKTEVKIFPQQIKEEPD